MAGLTSLVGAGVGLLGGILQGISAKKAHEKYANELMKVNLGMPGAVGQAEGIYNRQANQNMPGYLDMLTGIQSGIGSGMVQAEQASSSPTAILNTLAQLTTSGQQQANRLGVQNANYRTQQLGALANFLGSTKAGYQNEINQFNVDKQISAMKEKMLGSQALMKGITGGLGAAFSNFGAGEKLGFQQQQTNALSNMFGGGNSGGGMSIGDIMSLLGGGGGAISSVASAGIGGSIPGLATAALL